ncbi:MAG: hypothetical protein EOP50_11625 [Sphingobacteriales bacterium]|nr:MAG: hypothetical protein EOP50_11625 [Sphingobacteriales bacterium]
MMETRQKTVLITIGIVQVIGLLLTFGLGSSDMLLQSPVLVFGIINFCGGLFTVIIGLLALIVPDVRPRAQAIMGAGGIMMLLGFALCTGNG